MMVDPSNAVAQYSSLNKTERSSQPTSVTNEPKPNPENSVESGKTSEVGPAVVTSFSAAALETAKSVKASEQMADVEPPKDAAKDTDMP
ncbi:MAG: hypothetical protein OEV73_05970 [Desulfobulbaceae bacterium]|nr:hypothetical protein [Desulfobulbaceae bacterium]